MSTNTTSDQRLPVSVQLLSRISSYAQLSKSILAIFIFWMMPSLAPAMPASRIIYKRKPVHPVSIHSLKSTTSTLVDDFDEVDVNAFEGKDFNSLKFNKSSPFVKFTVPVMKSRSLSLMPFARRMSLPAKRFSETFTSAVSNPFHTPISSPFQSPSTTPFQSPFSTPVHSPFSSPIQSPLQSPLPSPIQPPIINFDRACYFSPLSQPPDEALTESYPEVSTTPEVDTVEEEFNIVIEKEEFVCTQSMTSNKSKPKRLVKFKFVSKRVKSLLRTRKRL